MDKLFLTRNVSRMRDFYAGGYCGTAPGIMVLWAPCVTRMAGKTSATSNLSELDRRGSSPAIYYLNEGKYAGISDLLRMFDIQVEGRSYKQTRSRSTRKQPPAMQ